MSHNYTPQSDSLYTYLRRTQKILSALEELNPAWAECIRSLLEEKDETIEEQRQELEEKDETIEEQRQELEANGEKFEEQRQEIDGLKRKLDCQPNCCDNDGSSNCAMSRSRKSYG